MRMNAPFNAYLDENGGEPLPNLKDGFSRLRQGQSFIVVMQPRINRGASWHGIAYSRLQGGRTNFTKSQRGNSWKKFQIKCDTIKAFDAKRRWVSHEVIRVTRTS